MSRWWRIGAITGLLSVGVFGALPGWNDICKEIDNMEPRCAFGRVGITAYIYNTTPYRPVLNAVSERYQSGDVLFTPHDSRSSSFLTDQMNRYLPEELLQANKFAPLETTSAGRRVWYLNTRLDDEGRADLAAMQTTHRLMQVFGGRDYRAYFLMAPPFKDPVVFGEALEFWGADTRVERGALTALLWWKVPSSLDLDYSIGLYLLNSEGALIAQVDQNITPPDGAESIPTSTMNPGDIYIDERRIQIPGDLPSGTYPLKVGVYQWWDGQRLLLEDGTDLYSLEPLVIP